MTTRTLFPETFRHTRIWQLYIEGDAVYRIQTNGTWWRLQERSIYGGSWQPVPNLDVPTFLALHHCTLADA